MGPLARLDRRALLGRQEQMATTEIKDRSGLRDPLDPMALTAPLVRPGRRALPGKQAETATMERSAPRVLRDRKDLPVRMDPMDLQVRLGHKGR